jgi:uncharacterized Ntn-hydrolase superfamily protein
LNYKFPFYLYSNTFGGKMNRILITLLLMPAFLFTQTPESGKSPMQPYKNQFAHTYSIVARDARTGAMGVAVQSHWFSVGSIVSWAEAGVGAVATQSFVNPAYGPEGIALMRKGLSASDALGKLVAKDKGEAFRQVAIIDAKGGVAAHTGAKCIESAGHQTGDQFSVQANMMLNDEVIPAMAAAFRESSGPLAERMLAAMQAAQNAGGDIRGQQSAAILVVSGTNTGKPWEDRLIDLRVEDHPEAIEEISRILRVHRAYEHMNKGDVAIEEGDIEGALKEYGKAESMFPENLEMQYWHAVALANANRIKASLPIFKKVFSVDENWRMMTPRLLPNGILNVSAAELKMIMDQ